MSYHRFIGGPHDGEWRDVRRQEGLFLPPYWTVAKASLRKVTYGESITAADVGYFTTTDYVPLPLHIGKHEVVTFFIERGMKPEDALLLLAANYRPSKPGGER